MIGSGRTRLSLRNVHPSEILECFVPFSSKASIALKALADNNNVVKSQRDHLQATIDSEFYVSVVL